MEILKKTYTTIKINVLRGVLTIKIDRPEANNSIDTVLVKELISSHR